MANGTKKYGRQKKSVAGLRYKAEGRLEKNRAKRFARHQRRMAEQASKRLAVPRGTARAARREGLLPKEVREAQTRQAQLLQLNAERVLARHSTVE
jgi:hypothetical protein